VPQRGAGTPGRWTTNQPFRLFRLLRMLRLIDILAASGTGNHRRSNDLTVSRLPRDSRRKGLPWP
jgi:hypothetical protein